MSKYRIINATTVKFGKYDDVLRVMAEREKGFWASLFSSGNTQFIISKESPLAKLIQNRTNTGNLLDIRAAVEDSKRKRRKRGYRKKA